MVYTGEKLRTVVPTRVSLMIHVFVLHPPPRTKGFAGTIASARGGFQHLHQHLHPPPRTKGFAGTIASARGGFQHLNPPPRTKGFAGTIKRARGGFQHFTKVLTVQPKSIWPRVFKQIRLQSTTLRRLQHILCQHHQRLCYCSCQSA